MSSQTASDALGVDSFREGENLPNLAAHCPQLMGLHFGFDPLCDDTDVETARDVIAKRSPSGCSLLYLSSQRHLAIQRSRGLHVNDYIICDFLASN
jgi:hypothetical protein